MAAGRREALSELLTPNAPGPEQQDAPLTEQERKLLVRLLSDPTYFPVEFRTWIRTYLEGSDIRLPSSAIVGGNQPKVNLPAGVILPFAGGAIPPNVFPCDGRAIDRAEYSLLFEAIGTTWGAGNGTSTFNIPDLRDRALYGAGSVVGLGATDGRALGQRGGPRHRHTFNQTSGAAGGHGHSFSGSTDSQGNHRHQILWGMGSGTTVALGTGGSTRYVVNLFNEYTEDAGSHSHGVSGSIGGVGDHTHNVSGDTSGGYDYDKPSFAGISYVITTGKQV